MALLLKKVTAYDSSYKEAVSEELNLNNWVIVCDAVYGSEGCTLMKILSLTIYQYPLNFLECMAAVILYRLPSPRFVV